MKKSKIFTRITFSFLIIIGLFFSSLQWLDPVESIKVEAAGPLEDNPPSSIILDGLFTTSSTGSNSSIINSHLVSVTPGTTNQKGAIWSIDDLKMDLTKDFTASMYLYFGNNGANAADGMAFVMHNDSRGVNAIAKSGASLGVWADEGYNGSKTSGIQKSFAVEFDTYKNDGESSYFDTNVNDDHVAWGYPGKADTYIDYSIGVWPVQSNRRTMKHNNVDGNTGVQYPGLLSNGTWRKFEVRWDAASQALTYQLEGVNAVTVAVNAQDVFGSTKVYWGFTGSTGPTYKQTNRVAFDKIPDLVNAEVEQTITRQDDSVVGEGSSVFKGDVLTYTLYAKYNGGLQNWKNIILNTVLNDHVTFIPGSMTLTTPGETAALDDNSWSGKSLALSIPNMNSTQNAATVSFQVKVNATTEAASVTETARFNGDNMVIDTNSIDYVIQPNQAPEVAINDAGPVYVSEGEDYEVKGTWNDSDNSKGTFYYELNSEEIQSEEKEKDVSSDSADWSFLLSKDQLNMGENTFEVYVTDENGAKSNVATLQIIVVEPPSLTLVDADTELPIDLGSGYTIKGTWSDADSDKVDLYYVLDKGEPIKFASGAANVADKGEEVSYEYTIPADQLSVGTHTVYVYSVDDTGRQSNVEKLTLNVIGQVSFTNVATDVSFVDMEIPNQPTFAKRNADWDIRVKDTRGTGSSWRLTATLSEDFSDGAGHYLLDALTFVDEFGKEEKMVLGVAMNVFEHTTKSMDEISIHWRENQGILLKMEPFVYIGDYKGRIKWNLVDAP
ncbi:hypothetical protein ACV242_001215 [Peribacillus simplex]